MENGRGFFFYVRFRPGCDFGGLPAAVPGDIFLKIFLEFLR